MQTENIENVILPLSKIGLLVTLTVLILSGCIANPDNTTSQKIITQTNESPRQGNVAVVTPNSGATLRKNSLQLKLEAIILDEIRGDWTDNNGNAYKLTKAAEQKMLERLFPEAEKQFELSFAGQNTKLAEDLTESNIETTITTYPDNTKTVTKRRLFSRGEEKLAVAIKNIETVSANIGQSLTKLSFVPKADENGQTNEVTKNCEETVRKILTTVHKQALNEVDESYK